MLKQGGLWRVLVSFFLHPSFLFVFMFMFVLNVEALGGYTMNIITLESHHIPFIILALTRMSRASQHVHMDTTLIIFVLLHNNIHVYGSNVL